MVPNLNQFGQQPVQGMQDLLEAKNTLPCQVDVTQATPLVAGQAVKLVDSAGGVPKVIAAAADTDDIFGFVNLNWKQASFAAGQALEVSAVQNVMYMTASEAISRGAAVKVVIASIKVANATTGATVVGRAYDKALANGDLIRVWITTFGMTKQVAA